MGWKNWLELRRARKALYSAYFLYRKRKNRLNDAERATVKEALGGLQTALLAQDAEATRTLRKEIPERLHFLKRSSLRRTFDFTWGMGIALFLALLIRQSLFELYEIPSGSMRPTLKEADRLIVSKTSFGLNLPFTPSHLYFDEALMKRGEIFVFTGEGIPFIDIDMNYFYLFPGKKQYVKRLMGKPGDTLYFYGGKVYGIDAESHDLLPNPDLKEIESVPFLHLEGRVANATGRTLIYQMNEPIAELTKSSGHLLPGARSAHDIWELWGMGNYAMARMVTRGEAAALGYQPPPGYSYFLEMKHHATLHRSSGRHLSSCSSLLPLDDAALKRVRGVMNTSRFAVEKEHALRLGMTFHEGGFLPRLSGVPDGTYEIEKGKAYEILTGGITQELPEAHPLAQLLKNDLPLLFNLGIEWDLRFTPVGSGYFPARFTYFRDGDLYFLNSPIVLKNEPLLKRFVAQEQQKREADAHYLPFIDSGAPLLADGTIDRERVMKYGLQIPTKMVLALGDNHPQSGDSREFGFVPENTIRGAPSWIFWPPGQRWGLPLQVGHPFFTLPMFVGWGIGLTFTFAYVYYSRRRKKLPLSF